MVGNVLSISSLSLGLAKDGVNLLRHADVALNSVEHFSRQEVHLIVAKVGRIFILWALEPFRILEGYFADSDEIFLMKAE